MENDRSGSISTDNPGVGRVRNAMYIRWLDEVRRDDRSIVGGKAANLGELIHAGVPCPVGFCVTASAFETFVAESSLRDKIAHILEDNSKPSIELAASVGRLFGSSTFPQEIAESIRDAYHELVNKYGNAVPIAVRSSALVEDSESSSFAGQFDSYLGIRDKESLIEAVKKCWLSLFNDRAIAYMRRKSIVTQDLLMAVIVQKLIRATKAGVMFTVHPVSLDSNLIVIEAAYGLGERLVSGRGNPDTYVVAKANLKLVKCKIGEKKSATVFDPGTGAIVEQRINALSQKRRLLTNHQLEELARWGKKIELHFGKAQDIEWAIENHTTYFVQTRPITTPESRKR